MALHRSRKAPPVLPDRPGPTVATFQDPVPEITWELVDTPDGYRIWAGCVHDHHANPEPPDWTLPEYGDTEGLYAVQRDSIWAEVQEWINGSE